MVIEPVMPTYARAEVAFQRGEGPYLFAADGRRFLDFGAGIAVASLGHAHPHLVSALKAQAETLWHTSNLFPIPLQERVGRRLAEASFADTVFFCNSGAEAVEATIKVARRYQHGRGRPDRYRTITFERAFHGRTLATLAAGNNPKHLEGFGPPVDGFDQVAWGDLEAVRAAVGPETAAILLEPVQGESGVRVADPGFLRGLRHIADEHDLLLLFDEVQCGAGRTGRFSAHEWSGVTPDVMAVAKGLGSGFPLGACLATETAARAMTAGSHGTTFGGTPLAMAVADAVLDIVLEPSFLEHVRAMADRLHPELEGLVARYPGILAGLQGQGLMLGLQVRGEGGENGTMVSRLRREGLITVPAGDNQVRLLPPLVVEDTHIDEALGLLDKVCAAMEGER